MTKDDKSNHKNSLHSELEILNELVYEKCGLALTNLEMAPESAEYGACRYKLNGLVIEHRLSKITPAKTGQFVTIWKRNELGITEPFNISDNIDFIAITSKRGGNIGQFIFPKSVLADKGIITQNGKEGKRGIRLYPSWDIATNKQAQKTQSWQIKYFIEISNNESADLDLVRKLFGITEVSR